MTIRTLERSRRAPARFTVALGAIVVAGLLARLAYALIVMHGVGVTGDGLELHLLAAQLAGGHGYAEPHFLTGGAWIPTADKPPLYPLLLAAAVKLGLGSVAGERVVSSLMGAALVAGVALLGRRVEGVRAGLVAAALAAVYPLLVVLDGSLRSESLYAPLVAFALLAAYRLRERPTATRALVLGVLVGLATLTRSEALVLLVLAPLAAATARVRALAVAALACAVVLAPWVARNWDVFGRPLLSTNSGSLVYGANCHAAYYSRLIGTWPCYPPLHATRTHNEADVSADLRRDGLRYARHHAGRVPAVMAVRLLRVWDLWSPRSAMRLEAAIDNRDPTVHDAGVIVYWLLLPLAAAGALLVRRRREPLAPLLVPVAMVSLLAVLAYGTTRFRVPAEIPIVVLASVALVALADRMRAR